MKIKLIDYGYKNGSQRAHSNDAGADVHACCLNDPVVIRSGETAKIPLGFGLEIPDGYMACIFPRSGLSSRGIVCEMPPIGSGYRGEIFAIVHNGSFDDFIVRFGDKIGQIVVLPIVIADFVDDMGEERGTDAFGSTGI